MGVMCGGDVGRGCVEVMWGGDKCSRTSCTTEIIFESTF